MPYLIDTSIAIHARDGTDSILDKLDEHDGSVLLSALSWAELQRGLFKRPSETVLRQKRLRELLDSIPIIPFDAAAAEAYGKIISMCGWVKGRDFDRMIAGHAISAGCMFVTANEADFKDIPGLRMEAWPVR